MANNQMVVTDSGFFNINRKIINERQFSSEDISIIGNTTIIDGVASDFDEESYLYKQNLTFNNSKLTIFMDGTFLPEKIEQVAWFLSGENPQTNNAILQFNDNRITVIVDSRVILEFKYMDFSEESSFKAIVELSPNSCRAIIKTKGSIFEKSAPISIPTNLSLLNKLYIGNDPTDSTEYWRGSLFIKNFKIEDNNRIIYTPSTGYPFKFSKLLMSDGTIELKDNTTPLARHVLKFELEEISRSGSSVLMVAHIGKDARLTVKEIGLYISTDNGEVLFSLIKGLNIYKGGDVPYDLVFTVNLSLNFVNVVGFPDVSSFLLESYTPALYKNFKTVQEVISWVITSLERIIELNAEKIGYNRAQVFYRLHQEMEQDEDCYSNIQSYSKLLKKFKLLQETMFDNDSINVEGDITLNDGVASNFSTNNYVTAYPEISENENWEFSLSFKTPANISISNSEAITTLVGFENTTENAIRILLFEIKYSSEDNKNYFSAKLQRENSGNYIINTNIFEVLSNQEYFIKMTHTISGNNHTYTILKSEDGKNYSIAYSITTTKITSSVQEMYIGVEPDYSNETATVLNPFLGFIDLKNWEIKAQSSSWSTLKVITYNDKVLQQYYRIPDLPKESYKTRDINNPDFYIEVLDNYEKGNGDLIDLSAPEGFSICTKVNLGKDGNPKIFLTKTNSENNLYFILAYLNQSIYFKLNLGAYSFPIQKTLTEEEIADYQSTSILLSVILTKEKNLLLYKNYELIGEFQGIFGSLEVPPSYFLTNSPSTELLTNVCSSINIPDFTTEEYVKLIKDNFGRYTENIITFRGSLTQDDLFYISHLTGCL